MPLSRVEELVADIRAGKMVILMDDEDREMKVTLSSQQRMYALKILTS